MNIKLLLVTGLFFSCAGLSAQAWTSDPLDSVPTLVDFSLSIAVPGESCSPPGDVGLSGDIVCICMPSTSLPTGIWICLPKYEGPPTVDVKIDDGAPSAGTVRAK